MIIRYIFFIFFMTCGYYCMSQVRNGYLCDVDTLLLCKPLSNDSICDEWEYVTLNGQYLKSKLLGVSFKEGKDSLDRYVKHIYYAPENYDDTELNQRVFFFILFDKHLNIIEVRQLNPPFGRDPERFKKMFTNIFKGTNGMWIKKVEGYDFYVYGYSTHLF